MDLGVETREMQKESLAILRKRGLIPAELYGHGLKNVHLMVKVKDFQKALKSAGESSLLYLSIEGNTKERHPVFIHDVQTHPITDDVMAIDFYQVRMDEKMTVKVPLIFIGEAPAVKSVGGILVKAMQEIEVEGLPAEIPHQIEVSLESLKEIGASLYVKDVTIPAKLRVLVDKDTVIATVTAMAAEEEVVAPAAVDLSTIKVEGEEKRAERAAKADAEGGAKEGGKTESAS